MDDNMENKMNEIGGKLEIIQSIMKAMNAALFGSEELERRDAYSMASLLEEKINDVTEKYNILVGKLNI